MTMFRFGSTASFDRPILHKPNFRLPPAAFTSPIQSCSTQGAYRRRRIDGGGVVRAAPWRSASCSRFISVRVNRGAFLVRMFILRQWCACLRFLRAVPLIGDWAAESAWGADAGNGSSAIAPRIAPPSRRWTSPPPGTNQLRQLSRIWIQLRMASQFRGTRSFPGPCTSQITFLGRHRARDIRQNCNRTPKTRTI